MLSPSEKLLVQHIIDSLTERIFFFQADDKAYEARVIPTTHDVDIALRSDYGILGKEKQAHWYAQYNVDPQTHSILMQDIGFDRATHRKLLETYVPNFVIQELKADSAVLIPKTHPNTTGITYIYFHLTDKEGIRQWFAARPDGHWRIAFGTEKDVTTLEGHLDATLLIFGLSAIGETEDEIRDTFRWLMEKIRRGELEYRLRTMLDFPSGLPGYCDFLGWPDDSFHDVAFENALQQALDTALAQATKDTATK